MSSLVQGSHGLWRSLKVWGKWDTLFKALKVCENWVGSVNLLGKNCQLISQKLHFPRPNSCLKNTICFVKSQRMHFLSVLTDRVRQLSATVRVAPLYQMCGSVVYIRVAFPRHSAKVCEKFVNFERIFLYEPWSCRLPRLVVLGKFRRSQSWSLLQMISLQLARGCWACLGNAMLRLTKLLLEPCDSRCW